MGCDTSEINLVVVVVVIINIVVVLLPVVAVHIGVNFDQ